MEHIKEQIIRGKTVKKLQEETSLLFLKHVTKIEDIKTLENIKSKLKGGK